LTRPLPFATRAHMANPLVGIIMGARRTSKCSRGRWKCSRKFGIEHEVRRALRPPHAGSRSWSGVERESRGLEVLIAGAGGAAHLPGVVAARAAPRPRSPGRIHHAGGADALLSIVQCPRGIRWETLAIGKSGAANAALLAVAILAGKRPELREKLRA